MKVGLLPTRSLPLMRGNDFWACSHWRLQACLCIGINSLMALKAFKSEPAELQGQVTG